MFDIIIDEIHNLIYLKNDKLSQQLFSRLTEKIPEAKAFTVGFLKRSTETPISINEADLVLAPTEFDFDPTSNAVAYLSSLIRASAIMELVPQLLVVISQRMIGEIFQVTEKCLTTATTQYRQRASKGLELPGQQFDELTPVFVPVLKGNMDKCDLKEFFAFVPFLKKLAGNLFGQLLTIANCIKIIGDVNEAIVNESGVPVDVYAFHRNCLSALHGEVKSFLSCLLHGDSAGLRTSFVTSPLIAIAEALEGKVVEKKIPVLFYQLTNISEEAKSILEGIYGANAVLTPSELSAARKMAHMMAVDPLASSLSTGSGAGLSGHRLTVKPNLQYLAIVYRLFVQFDEFLQFLFARDHSDVRHNDAIFVEEVLSKEYIPTVESFVIQELAAAFNGADALLWQEVVPIDQTLAIGKGANCMLNCVASFVGLFCQVICVLHQIPGSQAECEQLLGRLMELFLEKCQNKFADLVTNKGNEETTTSFMAISSQFIVNEQLRDLLSQHSMLSSGDENETLDAMLAQKEILLLEKLKNDRSLHRSEIIFDYRMLRSVALLQRNLVTNY